MVALFSSVPVEKVMFLSALEEEETTPVKIASPSEEALTILYLGAEELPSSTVKILVPETPPTEACKNADEVKKNETKIEFILMTFMKDLRIGLIYLKDY